MNICNFSVALSNIDFDLEPRALVPDLKIYQKNLHRKNSYQEKTAWYGIRDSIRRRASRLGVLEENSFKNIFKATV